MLNKLKSIFRPFFVGNLKFITWFFIVFTFIGTLTQYFFPNEIFLNILLNLSTGLFSSLLIIRVIDLNREQEERLIDLKREQENQVKQVLYNLRNDQVYVENQINNLWLVLLTYDDESYLFFNHHETFEKKKVRDATIKQLIIFQLLKRILNYCKSVEAKNYYSLYLDDGLSAKLSQIIKWISDDKPGKIEISDINNLISLLNDFVSELKDFENIIFNELSKFNFRE